MTEPRRIGEILPPALARLESSDQGRAYAAWARAAGPQVAGGAQPRSFGRGTLTVECSSSVWANELTYLSDQILRRMAEVAPGHPVKRLRFLVGRSPQRQESEPAATKDEGGEARRAPLDLRTARAQADQVDDDRLKAAITAALRSSAGEAPEPPGRSAS